MEATNIAGNATVPLSEKFGDGDWQMEWQAALSEQPDLNLFALVDVAQEPSLLRRFHSNDLDSACLYGYEPDSPIAKATPRLLQIDRQRHETLLSYLVRQSKFRPLGTMLAATCNLSELTTHLRACMDVRLDGHDDMFLAIWDPAILGTLLGETADQTLHMQGPALTAEQAKALVGPVLHWWYWDRKGNCHNIAKAVVQSNSSPESIPLQLDSQQVDMLVEASVPDHLLYHLNTNLPELIEKLVAEKRYDFVRQQLKRGREHGLDGTGDLVNYIAIALAFGARFDEITSVAQILQRVKDKELSFEQAMKLLPEDEMSESAQAPELLEGSA